MSLLKTITEKGPAVDLKNSDATDAGASDVMNKADSGRDISFSLMRNTINSDGKVTGSDVANYLERAAELNDEVDTVPFGLETDDGQIVKVYVNAEQADAFEEALKNLLGIEDDIEEAINRLASQFDIVDVVWPKGARPDEEAGAEDTELTIDDGQDDEEFSDHDEDVEASVNTEDEPREVTDATYSDASSKEVSHEGEPNCVLNVPEDSEISDTNIEEFIGGQNIIKIDSFKLEGSELKIYTQDGDEVAPEIVDQLQGAFEAFLNEHGLFAVKQESTTKMTIGSKFLSRITEAKAEDRDGINDGFNIPLDSQARALISKMRRPYEKKLVAFFVMSGVPGRFLNNADTEDSITAASDMLRKQTSIRRNFDLLYTALANAKGFNIPDNKVEEAKGTKRGSFMQKLFESVLIKLGLPGSLVDTGGPNSVATGIYRTARMIEENTDVERALRQLAVRLGVKAADAIGPVDEAHGHLAKVGWYVENAKGKNVAGPLSEKDARAKCEKMGGEEKGFSVGYVSDFDARRMDEALNVGNDAYANAVIELAAALGVPTDVLGLRQSQVVQSLRKTKSELRNRSQVLGMMNRLLSIVKTNKRPNTSSENETENEE